MESFSEIILAKWIFVLSGESLTNLPVSSLQLANRNATTKRLIIPFIQHLEIYSECFTILIKKAGLAVCLFLLWIVPWLLWFERSITQIDLFLWKIIIIPVGACILGFWIV